jgi:hypothetical protein
LAQQRRKKAAAGWCGSSEELGLSSFSGRIVDAEVIVVEQDAASPAHAAIAVIPRRKSC